MTHVLAGGQDFQTVAYQPVVWLSVSEGLAPPSTPHPPFPAIVDSGCTFDFLINQSQFHAWVPQSVRQKLAQPYVVNAANVALYSACLWLFPNVPGATSVDSSQQPHLFVVDRFTVALPGSQFFRTYPLFGLPAFRKGQLRVEFDGPPEHMNIDVY